MKHRLRLFVTVIILQVVPLYAQESDMTMLAARRAAWDGQVDLLKAWLEHDSIRPVSKDMLNQLLHSASAGGKLSTAVLLLDYGADIDCQLWRGFAPIHYAASYSEADSLFFELLRRNAKVLLRDSAGVTPLHYAAKIGSRDKMLSLLDRNIDPNDKDSAGQTPLVYAVSYNNVEAIDLLIERGASIDVRTNAGKSLIEIAWNLEPQHPRNIDSFFEEREGERSWGGYPAFKALIAHEADLSPIGWKSTEPAMKFAEVDDARLLDMAFQRGSLLSDTVANNTDPIHIAARFNSDEVVRYLRDKSVLLDEPDEQGDTPLIIASRRGCIDVARILIQSGANVNYQDTTPNLPNENIFARYRTKTNPLRWAIAGKHFELAILLIKSGANPDQSDGAQEPLLHIACVNREYELVKLMLNKGVDANVENGGGYSAIEQSLRVGDLKTAKLLRSHGASLDQFSKQAYGLDAYGGIPLLNRMAAIGEIESSRWLLDEGAENNTLDRFGKTPLFQAAFNDQVEIIKLLKMNGIDLNAQKGGTTCLHVAALGGSENAMKYLLDQKVDPNVIDKDGNTPLGTVIYFGPTTVNSVEKKDWVEKQCHIAELLVKYSADVNAKTNGVPLVIAALNYNYYTLARAYLTLGAKAEYQDENGNTLFHFLANRNSDSLMVSLLLEFGADPNSLNKDLNSPLNLAANRETGNDPVTSFWGAMLNAGANINNRNKEGVTPLSSAVGRSNPIYVKYLLENGADPNIPDFKGGHLLQGAVWHRDVIITKLLLQHGANPNIRLTYHNSMPIHMAAHDCYFDIVRLLLDYGADPNVKDDNGSTALHYVANSHYPNEGSWALESLLKAKADPKIRNNDGELPIDIARRVGNGAVIALLEKATNK